MKLLRGQIDTMQTAYLKISTELESATSALVAVARVFTEDAEASPQKRKRFAEALDSVSTKRPATAESAASSVADSVAAVATLDEQADPSASADSATERAALFERANPEAVSAARRSLAGIVFHEYKTGKFVDEKDPTCLSSIACPFDIKKESAKFTRSMKVLRLN
jgi:hypothetical protein